MKRASNDALAGFFGRLGALERVLRLVTGDAGLRVLFDLRGDDPRQVVLDLQQSPVAVVFAGPDETLRCDVTVAIEGDHLHRVFLDHLAPSQAVGRRQMLLRGSASHLAQLIPLFDLAPTLYRDHLADLGWPGFERARQENTMSQETTQATSDGQAGSLERGACQAVTRAAWGLGWAVGLTRYHVLPSLSLFDVLTSLTKGLDAATPVERKRAG